MNRKTVSTGAPWEPIVGYARATRCGPLVSVSGTIAFGDDGAIVGAGDAAAQTRRIFEHIGAALERCGAGFGDVIRTRMYVTDIADWEAVGRVHGEIFGDNRPATSMVQVAGLIDPEARVEIEADAWVECPGA